LVDADSRRLVSRAKRARRRHVEFARVASAKHPLAVSSEHRACPFPGGMPNLRTLVVGCRGMLGSDLMEELGVSHDVVGLDLPEIDLTGADAVSAAVGATRPDVIINSAAYTRVDDCETHRDLA